MFGSFKELPKGVLVSLLSLPVAAAATTGLAWLDDRLSPWELLVLFFVFLVLGVSGVNQGASLWARYHVEPPPPPPPPRTPDELRRELQEWLLRLGYQIGPATESIPVDFGFGATDANGRLIILYKKPGIDTLIMYTGRVLSPAEKTTFNSMPPSARDATLRQMRMALAHFGIWFNLLDQSGFFQVNDDVRCDDSLTETIFLDHIKFIRRAHVLVFALVEAALTEGGRYEAIMDAAGDPGHDSPADVSPSVEEEAPPASDTASPRPTPAP